MQRKILRQWPLPDHTANYQLLQHHIQIWRSPCILQIPVPLGLLTPTPSVTSTTAGTHSQHLCTQSPAPPWDPYKQSSLWTWAPRPPGHSCIGQTSCSSCAHAILQPRTHKHTQGQTLVAFVQQAFPPGNFSATFTAGVLELWGSICSCVEGEMGTTLKNFDLMLY